MSLDPLQRLRDFRKLLDLTYEDACEVAGISPSRFRRGRPCEVSPDALVRFDRGEKLYGWALEMAGGDRERALDWIYGPLPGASGEAPINLIDTEAEFSQVVKAVAALREAAGLGSQVSDELVPPLNPLVRYRVKEGLERVFLAKPDLSRAQLTRFLNSRGLKVDAGRISRLALGYSDATAQEVEFLAEACGCKPHELLTRK